MEFISGNQKDANFTLKVVISGKEKIGKTIFALRLSNNYNNKKFFNSNNLTYAQTNGVSYSSSFIKFKNLIFLLDIWDMGGNEKYIALEKVFVKDAHIVLYFYDSFDRKSLEKIKNSYITIKDVVNNMMVFLIRVKYDLNIKSDNNENIDFVSDEEAMEYADKNNMIFLHISSFEKYDNGIENLLNLILKLYLFKINNNNYNYHKII